MMKKIVFILVLLLSFSINNAFASMAPSGGFGASDPFAPSPTSGISDFNTSIPTGTFDVNGTEKMATEAASSASKTTGGEASSASSGGPDDITSTDFTIDTSLFSIGGNNLKGYDSKTTINNTLGNIIQKLMIALGVIALGVMSIGAGYMILYHGQDEYLSKGKNIFMGGITALVVALSSYYLVNLVGYILYK